MDAAFPHAVKRTARRAEGKDVSRWSTLFVASMCAAAAGAAAAFGAPRADPLPVIPPISEQGPELDMPQAVQARYARRERAALKLLRAAAADPVTRAAGCVPAEFANELGPPLPTIRTQVLGRHVEFAYRFRHVPASLGCRPWSLTVVISGPASYGGAGRWVQGFDVHTTPAGRIVMPLPKQTKAPFTYIVAALTITGRRGALLRGTVNCRGACLPSLTFNGPQPRHPLPVKLARSQLEASLRFVVSREREWPPSRVACASRTRCTITYADPLYPKQPFRIGYTLSGERLPGCWMALSTGPLDPLPYQDVEQGERELAGCLSWGALPRR